MVAAIGDHDPRVATRFEVLAEVPGDILYRVPIAGVRAHALMRLLDPHSAYDSARM